MPGVDVYELLCLKVQQAVERRRAAVETVRRLEAFTKSREQVQGPSRTASPAIAESTDPGPLEPCAMTQIPAEILQSWDESSRREWLVTNGIGGYASSSRGSGANTRRYHGLLVPALSPTPGPRRAALQVGRGGTGRGSVVSALRQQVSERRRSRRAFGTSTYFGTRPVPTFTYVSSTRRRSSSKNASGWRMGKNTVYVQYTSRSRRRKPVRFGLVPLLAYKDYHSEQHRWDGFHGDARHGTRRAVKVRRL